MVLPIQLSVFRPNLWVGQRNHWSHQVKPSLPILWKRRGAGLLFISTVSLYWQLIKRSQKPWSTPVLAVKYSSTYREVLQYLPWSTPVLTVKYSSTCRKYWELISMRPPCLYVAAMEKRKAESEKTFLKAQNIFFRRWGLNYWARSSSYHQNLIKKQ